MLRDQSACDDPDAAATSGLVAYVDHDPAGWVAVQPRTAYPKLATSRVPWSGRDEDPGDDGIWAVQGLPGARPDLPPRTGRDRLRPAARRQGARGIPDDHPAGQGDHPGEAHVGARQVFERAGFREVSHPTIRSSGSRAAARRLVLGEGRPLLEKEGQRAHPLTLPGLEPTGADRSEVTLADRVAAVVAAIDACDPGEKVLLVGHSAGCGVACAAVDRRPGRVARVVYVGGWPTPDGLSIAGGFPTDGGDLPMPDFADFDEPTSPTSGSGSPTARRRWPS